MVRHHSRHADVSKTEPHLASLVVDRAGSGAMFDGIARRYDLLNRLISFGLDRRWRRRLVALTGRDAPALVLDVATGTADVAIELVQTWPALTVVGLDPSAGMLDRGRQKISVRELQPRIMLCQGDVQGLPFAAGTFTAVCISFGIRNVAQRVEALREMVRVTKTGGQVAVLELAEPRAGLLAPLARFHIHVLVPRLGGLLSGNEEYRYLQQSIAAFPSAEEFSLLMEQAGLIDVRIERLSFGVAFLFVGTKGAA